MYPTVKAELHIHFRAKTCGLRWIKVEVGDIVNTAERINREAKREKIQVELTLQPNTLLTIDDRVKGKGGR